MIFVYFPVGAVLFLAAIRTYIAWSFKRHEQRLFQESREAQAALAFGLHEKSEHLDRRAEHRLHRLDQRLQASLRQMDAHIAMVLERVDRERS